MYVTYYFSVGSIFKGLPIHFKDFIADFQIILISRRTFDRKDS